MHVTELQFLALFRAWGRLALPPRPPHAFRGRKYGQQRGRFSLEKQRCRCARSNALLAAHWPYPPPSGALIAPPTTQVQPNRPLRLLPMLRTAQPQQSHEPGRNAKHPPLLHTPPTYVSSSFPVKATALLTHAPMRRAVTRAATALRYTALRCSALEGTVLRRTAPALHLHCTVQRTGSCRRRLRPLPRVRTLRCGAGWSCGSDGDRRVLRDDDAAFVGPAS